MNFFLLLTHFFSCMHYWSWTLLWLLPLLLFVCEKEEKKITFDFNLTSFFFFFLFFLYFKTASWVLFVITECVCVILSIIKRIESSLNMRKGIFAYKLFIVCKFVFLATKKKNRLDRISPNCILNDSVFQHDLWNRSLLLE